jgi:hypothetical protein
VTNALSEVEDESNAGRDTLSRHNLPNSAVWWLCPGTASTTGWRSPEGEQERRTPAPRFLPLTPCQTLPSATSLPGSRTKLHLRPTLVLGHRFVHCVSREAERGDHGTKLCSTSSCMNQPCPRTPAFAQ